jgi:hypothetical protein
MNDKNLIQKIQSDFIKSNPKIINNNDNTSLIQKNFNSKYTEDISDSDDDDLVSYKNRNNKMLDDLPSVNSTISKSNKKTKTKVVRSTKKATKEKEEKIENKLEQEHLEQNLDSNLESDMDSEPEYEYSEEFKKKVKDYVKNDDRIRELQSELKVLNGAKKNAEMEILKHLERLGESNININGGKLRINQYESKEGLKEELIKEALGEKIKDPKIIEFIFEKINEKRVANGKVQKSLKRTFERGGNKKK